MPGLEPGIQGHKFVAPGPWIAGSSPAMTYSYFQFLFPAYEASIVSGFRRAPRAKSLESALT
jgi:hypothetical protein